MVFGGLQQFQLFEGECLEFLPLPPPSVSSRFNKLIQSTAKARQVVAQFDYITGEISAF